MAFGGRFSLGILHSITGIKNLKKKLTDIGFYLVSLDWMVLFTGRWICD